MALDAALIEALAIELDAESLEYLHFLDRKMDAAGARKLNLGWRREFLARNMDGIAIDREITPAIGDS